MRSETNLSRGSLPLFGVLFVSIQNVLHHGRILAFKEADAEEPSAERPKFTRKHVLLELE